MEHKGPESELGTASPDSKEFYAENLFLGVEGDDLLSPGFCVVLEN